MSQHIIEIEGSPMGKLVVTLGADVQLHGYFMTVEAVSDDPAKEPGILYCNTRDKGIGGSGVAKDLKRYELQLKTFGITLPHIVWREVKSDMSAQSSRMEKWPTLVINPDGSASFKAPATSVAQTASVAASTVSPEYINELMDSHKATLRALELLYDTSPDSTNWNWAMSQASKAINGARRVETNLTKSAVANRRGMQSIAAWMSRD